MRQRSGNVSALSVILLALILELLSPSTCAREVNGGAFSRPPQSPSDEYKAGREQMVREQIEARGIRDPRVLAALRKVPRHLFVPPEEQGEAYNDYPLAIGHAQTISQPYVVGYMTDEDSYTDGWSDPGKAPVSSFIAPQEGEQGTGMHQESSPVDPRRLQFRGNLGQ